MNVIILQAINMLASLILGSDVFTRVLGVVQRWADKEISSAEKREGVLEEIEIIGLKLSKSLANLAVELAVAYTKKAADLKPDEKAK
jgi:hypothetical protein